MTDKKIWAIIDLQFGSTGKGLIAGILAKERRPDTVITAWGPNAGHTFIDANGRKYIHTMVANGVVSPDLKRLMVGPGSVIDPVNFMAELGACADHLTLDHIYIHENAAVVLPEHVGKEAHTMMAIGSTKKGVGEALMHRIKRDPTNMNTARHALKDGLADRVVTTAQWLDLLHDAEKIQIEGAQGYSLSMYHGFYPYVTSRDVSVNQVMADCGIPTALAKTAQVVGTCRTYPIRVANRYVLDKQVGWSGPGYDDQREITFEEIGQEVEFTTVTKLPRRIFTYSRKQMEEAIRMNGVDVLFLNFANYVSGGQLRDIVEHLSSLCDVRWIGHGPSESDVHHV
jgi:adenylosuccinate synthase